MAFERHRTAFPGIAIATISSRVPVRVAPTGAQDRAVVPVATTSEPVFGFSADTGAVPGAALPIHDEGNTVKVVAAASIGVGAEVGIASSNGAMGPIAGASGVVRHSAGLSVTAAAEGEVFSLYVRPRQLSGAV